MKGKFYRVIKGLSNKEKTSIGSFYKNVGKYPKIFTSNIRCIGNSILGLVGVPHIRKLCGNTKIIRRVFADNIVVYSYYQDFTIQLKLENLGSSKT